ncbi:MAG TPA: hypothetical protein VJ183_00825 [Chloroflexia bacterium]|nr:hypothetical protein [Chloroflexia bacterium]
MSEIQAVPLVSDQGDTYVDCDHVVDGASNHFVGYIEMAGNETWATIKRYAPDGVITGEWTVIPSAKHKIDELTLAHSGDSLLLLFTTHEIKEQKPRSIRIESATIAGVYSVRAGMEMEEGGAGAFTGNGGGPGGDPQEDGMTVEELTDALANPNHPLTVTLGKLIKNRGREAVAQEMVERKLLTLDNIYTSHGLYQRFVETTGEQVLKSLATYRVCKED